MEIEYQVAADSTVGRGDKRRPAVTHYYTMIGEVTDHTYMVVQLPSGNWFRVCERCGGDGYFPSQVNNGVCFTCNGTGLGDLLVEGVVAVPGDLVSQPPPVTARLKKWRSYRAGVDRRRKRVMEEAETDRQRWRTDNADIVDWCQARVPTGSGNGVDDEEGELFDDLPRELRPMVVVVRSGSRLDHHQTRWFRVLRDRYDSAVEVSRHHGAGIGAKATLRGRVVVAKSVETQWGLTRMLVVAGDGPDVGVTFVTFSSAKSVWAQGVDVGAQVEITATITGQDTFEGKARDKVTRPKVSVVRAADSEEAIGE